MINIDSLNLNTNTKWNFKHKIYTQTSIFQVDFKSNLNVIFEI